MSSSAVSADADAGSLATIPVICGPTASGKSAIAMWLSLRREIVRLLQGEGVAAALEAEPAAPAEEKHVPLSVAVEIRYDDGTLTKKVFPSNDDAIVFLRERAEG